MVGENVNFVDDEVRAVYTVRSVDAELVRTYEIMSKIKEGERKRGMLPSFLMNWQISLTHSTGTSLSPEFRPASSFPVS